MVFPWDPWGGEHGTLVLGRSGALFRLVEQRVPEPLAALSNKELGKLQR